LRDYLVALLDSIGSILLQHLRPAVTSSLRVFRFSGKRHRSRKSPSRPLAVRHFSALGALEGGGCYQPLHRSLLAKDVKGWERREM